MPIATTPILVTNLLKSIPKNPQEEDPVAHDHHRSNMPYSLKTSLRLPRTATIPLPWWKHTKAKHQVSCKTGCQGDSPMKLR